MVLATLTIKLHQIKLEKSQVLASQVDHIPYQVLLVQNVGIYVGVHHFQWKSAALVLF